MSTANELTRAILQYLTMIGITAWRSNSGAYAVQPEGGNRRFIRFGTKGSGDILGIVPPTGQFLSIEVKVGRDTLRDSQREWIQRVEDAGGLALVAHSLDDVIKFFEAQGLPFKRPSTRAARRKVTLPRSTVRRGTRAEAFDYNNPNDVADLMRLQIAEGERGLAKLLE